MKKNQLPLIVRIKAGMIGGFITASLMAGFDFADGQPFSIIKFLLFFFISGLVMALIIRPKEETKS